MIHLVSAADEAYAPGLHVTVASALLALSPSLPVTFHILDGGLSSSALEKLELLSRQCHPHCSVVLHPINAQDFQNWNPGPNNSMMAYARLFLGSLLDANKAIYLDSDTIVLGDLKELWEAPMKGKIVLGALGGEGALLGGDCPWPLLPGEENFPYINSGVIVLDLEQWRLQQIETQVVTLIDDHSVICTCYDQTILNYLMRYQIGLLPMSWNWQGRILSEEQASSVKVVHFITPKKPWFWWSGDRRFRCWRSFYKTHIGSITKLFLKKGALSGLFYGLFETQVRRRPCLRWGYVQLLSLSCVLKKNKPSSRAATIIKEYYTTGLGGPSGDAEFQKHQPILKILSERLG